MNTSRSYPSDASVDRESHRQTKAARVAQVLQGLKSKLEAGEVPSRETLRSEYPDICDDLLAGLESLKFIFHVTPQLVDGACELDGQTADITPRQNLGDFRIIREIGRGGMGIVYEAEELSLARQVALKVLPFASMLDAKQLQRFKNEAKAAATIHHPHIVPVFSVGCERGVHYYAMQYIEGQSLAEVVSELKDLSISDQHTTFSRGDDLERHAASADVTLDGDERANLETKAAVALSTERSAVPQQYYRSVARLGLQAAEGLEHAHQMGVVHRDVKPSNLLLDRHAQLWITDFGLATTLTDANLTISGDVLGTLRYMSPEQASGMHTVLDHRSDIYSLGVTLYEIVTLRRAFDGTDRQQLLRQVMEDEPVPPSKFDSQVPRDLETIVLKAMSKDPNARFHSAREMADDLRCFVESKPIFARRASSRERTYRWAKRNPALAMLTVVVFILLTVLSLAGIGGSIYLADVAEHSRQRLYVADINRVQALIQAGDIFRAARILDRYASSDGKHDPRGFEWHYLRSRCQAYVANWTFGHPVDAFCACYSPDGRILATSGWTPNIFLWDLSTGKKVRTFEGHKAAVDGLVFSRDGKTLFSTSADGTTRLWDVASGEQDALVEVDRDRGFRSLAVSTNEALIAAGSAERVPNGPHDSFSFVCVWEAKTKQPITYLDGLVGNVSGLAFSGDDKYLVAGDDSGNIHVWETSTWKPARSVPAHQAGVTSIAFSPDGKSMASGGGVAHDDFTRGEITLWNVETWSERETFHHHDHIVSCVCFSPDGTTLVAGSFDHAISIWDLKRGTCRKSYRGHAGRVRGLGFSPDGYEFCSTSSDNTVKTWDLRRVLSQPTTVSTLGNRTAYKPGLAFADNDSAMCTVDVDGNVTKWEVATGEIIYRRSMPAPIGGSAAIAVSRDNQYLAAATGKWPSDETTGAVCIFELATGDLRHELDIPRGFLHGLTFSPDSRFLVHGDKNFAVMWDVQSGQQIAELGPLQNGYVKSICYSPDGARVAIATNKGLSFFFDARDYRLLRELGTEDGWGTLSIAYSPAGDVFATSGGDRVVKLWNASTYEQLPLEFEKCADWIFHVAFSHDGRRILSASKDGTIRIWHRDLGESLLTLRQGDRWLWNGQFSRDDRMIAATADAIKVWRVDEHFEPLLTIKATNQPCHEAFENAIRLKSNVRRDSIRSSNTLIHQ